MKWDNEKDEEIADLTKRVEELERKNKPYIGPVSHPDECICDNWMYGHEQMRKNFCPQHGVYKKGK